MYRTPGSPSLFTGGRILAVLAAVGFVFFLAMIGQFVQNVDAQELVVIQSVTGDLACHTTPGPKWQGFGKVTTYQRRAQYEFDNRVRFNDGGHADHFVGSIQFELPVDCEQLLALHAKFNSQQAVEEQLVKKVVDKAIYMSGPLMSSKESSAEKRGALVWYVEDQIEGGVYKTTQRDERRIDEITGQEQTVTIVTIVEKEGVALRQEKSYLTAFGVNTSNFSIEKLDYEDRVEKQISEQQQAAMSVQTAIAEAKQAEQKTLTVIEKGKAQAAEEKWKQEAIKAREVTRADQEKQVAVTEAQKRLEVNTLDAQAAEQYRIAQIKKGEGDSAYKRLVMEADGALQQKLDAYVKVQNRYAEAIEKYQGAWVPNVQFGQTGNGSTNGATTLIDLLSVKAAKDLSVEVTPKR